MIVCSIGDYASTFGWGVLAGALLVIGAAIFYIRWKG